MATGTVVRYVDPTNMRSMKYTLKQCVHVSMSRLDEVAKFLCDFIFKMKAFRLYFGGYYLEGDTILKVLCISWREQPVLYRMNY